MWYINTAASWGHLTGLPAQWVNWFLSWRRFYIPRGGTKRYMSSFFKISIVFSNKMLFDRLVVDKWWGQQWHWLCICILLVLFIHFSVYTGEWWYNPWLRVHDQKKLSAKVWYSITMLPWTKLYGQVTVNCVTKHMSYKQEIKNKNVHE